MAPLLQDCSIKNCVVLLNINIIITIVPQPETKEYFSCTCSRSQYWTERCAEESFFIMEGDISTFSNKKVADLTH